jgi:hypothetical protein
LQPVFGFPPPSITFTGKGLAPGPCAGFDDVAASSAFCSSIAFIRNRGVTLGCSSTSYCPSDPVTRLALSAFMTRLGIALTPQYVFREENFGPLSGGPNPVVCRLAVPPESYARTVIADGVIDVDAAGMPGVQSEIGVSPVGTFDGGVSWGQLSNIRTIVTTEGFGGAATITGPLIIPAEETALMGLQLTGQSWTLDGGSCKLRVTITSSSAP